MVRPLRSSSPEVSLPISSRALLRLLIALALPVLGACGADPQPRVSAGAVGSKQIDEPQPIAGRVTPGWSAAGRLSLEELRDDGTRVAAGTVDIDADGTFTIVPPAPGTVLLASFRAEGQPVLRAVFDVSSLRASTVTLSPFSEAAVRSIEASPHPDWRASSVRSANQRIAATVGVDDLIAYVPRDPAGANLGGDARMTLFGRAAAALAERLEAPEGRETRAHALDSLVRMLSVDPYDDRIMPAYVAGIAGALDASVPDSDGKRALIGSLLLLEPAATDARLAAALPRGVASGAGSAPMTDDAYALIGSVEPPLAAPGTVFNERGALVAFQSQPGQPVYRGLHTASVGEVFADGEIGLGRWHGGVIASYLRDAEVLSHPADADVLDVDGGMHYAVVREAKAVPACGQRRLARIAVTLATGVPTPERISVAPESMVAIQYAGSAMHVGFDLAFHSASSRGLRARTPGTLRAPWASGIVAAPDGSFDTELPLTDGTRAAGRVRVSGRIGGQEARKVVMHLVTDTGGTAPIEQVAAFAGAAGAVDARGCVGDSSSLGTGLKVRSRTRADRGLAMTAAGVRYELFL